MVATPQVHDLAERVMRDIEAVAPAAQPNLDPELLRTQFPPIGCWAPTCVPLSRLLRTVFILEQTPTSS